MNIDKVLAVLPTEKLQAHISDGFTKLGLSSVEMLSDDDKVNNAADAVYKKLPLIPIRAAIKSTLGQEGFVRLIFKVRDQMIVNGSMDMSWLTPDKLRNLFKS